MLVKRTIFLVECCFFCGNPGATSYNLLRFCLICHNQACDNKNMIMDLLENCVRVKTEFD